MSPTENKSGDTAPLIEARGLQKHFPVGQGWFGRQVLKAVDGIDLRIDSGKTVGLVGESGCGKSTLGRAILRLHEPTGGDVLLRGKSLTALDRAALRRARRDMQIIFQDPFASLSPRRTVAQIIREPLDLHRIGSRAERQQRVLELLDTVGMRSNALDRYPHEFSGGQRQRIGIARALALEPQFIVADEPVSALDVSVQSQVLNLLAKLQQERGIAFLFISHDLAVVQHVSDEVAVMYLGRIVEQAPVMELYKRPQHPYTQSLLSAIPVPDPGRGVARIRLEGEVPSPLSPPSGCPFRTRCNRASEQCAVMNPPLTDAGAAGHRVACHHPGPDK